MSGARAAVSSHAATWRDETGAIIASVYGGTMCLAPRLPRDLASQTDDGGFETIMRCRNCDGCRNYDRLVRRRELALTYAEVKEDLWLIEFECPFPSQPKLAARLHRSGVAAFEPAFYRQSLKALAMLARGSKPSAKRLRSYTGAKVKVSRVRRPEKLRPWRKITAGILVTRSEWGEQVKRFYHKGIQRMPREVFIKQTRGGIRKRHSAAMAGARAWREGAAGGETLYPSDRLAVQEFIHARKSRALQALSRSILATAAPLPSEFAAWEERMHKLRLIFSKPDDGSQPADPIPPSTINRGRAAGAPSSSSMPGFRNAPDAQRVGPHASAGQALPQPTPPKKKTGLTISQAGRDASSLPPKSDPPAQIDAWLARMRELARKRGSP